MAGTEAGTGDGARGWAARLLGVGPETVRRRADGGPWRHASAGIRPASHRPVPAPPKGFRPRRETGGRSTSSLPPTALSYAMEGPTSLLQMRATPP
ncbi:hypothetical protein GCM10017667_47250 [Streptomyces filamentosus]|uniref:Uncharacterized protein n=1 Tax=Streptomyces filamentosus TaxID=67294 RepID=A0A919EQA6_STRFL|nr:hypothetical protein GCM10017667_47250 [Streptomyces filamentosus]